MKKVLFIDRDGVLLMEPNDEQIDSIDKVKFAPYLFSALGEIAAKMDYKLVMVTNQDGLGTSSFPEDDFWPIQDLLLRSLKNEGIQFDEIHIDRSFAHENSLRRKPNTGMLTRYMDGTFDLEHSFVIGDRWSDMQLAQNLGCKGIWINPRYTDKLGSWRESIVLEASSWKEILEYLQKKERIANISRSTTETSINIRVNLDGDGYCQIDTGLPFFDHMLEQISKHGRIDLFIDAKGDLDIDDHHTIEDVGLALGTAFAESLGTKAGIERYGFSLPMDDCAAKTLLDFGGRPWLVWDAEFRKERIGGVSTEMFFHFFKSFSDNAKCNLNIQCLGDNDHHKIEAIFKCFARALKMAVKRNNDFLIPSTKGVL